MPLVVVGQWGPATSHMTADEGALFSERPVVVTEILSNLVEPDLAVGDTIAALYYGGEITMQGRRIRQRVPGELYFQPGGPYCIVFDRFLPEADAYVTGPTAIRLVGNPMQARLDLFRVFLSMSRQEFLELARDAIARMPNRCLEAGDRVVVPPGSIPSSR